MPIDLEQSLENLKLERDAIQLYDALATIEKEPVRAAAFRTIAGNERRHADVWATRLAGLGASVPPPGGPRFRGRAIIVLARILGTHALKDLGLAPEGGGGEATGRAPPAAGRPAGRAPPAMPPPRPGSPPRPRSRRGSAGTEPAALAPSGRSSSVS